MNNIKRFILCIAFANILLTGCENKERYKDEKIVDVRAIGVDKNTVVWVQMMMVPVTRRRIDYYVYFTMPDVDGNYSDQANGRLQVSKSVHDTVSNGTKLSIGYSEAFDDLSKMPKKRLVMIEGLTPEGFTKRTSPVPKAQKMKLTREEKKQLKILEDIRKKEAGLGKLRIPQDQQ